MADTWMEGPGSLLYSVSLHPWQLFGRAIATFQVGKMRPRQISISGLPKVTEGVTDRAENRPREP